MTDDERRLGELMKATKVAICHFVARTASSPSDSAAMRRMAEDIQAYPVSSKRRLGAMRSGLDATVRDLKRQVSLGYRSPPSYDLLVEQLRKEGLIDISTWIDSDEARMKEILERGEIRRAAELRLATEYRDFADERLQDRIDRLIASYEAARTRPREKRLRRRSSSNRANSVSEELLRRSAIAALEYAAGCATRAEFRLALEEQARNWRTIQISDDLLERAFWESMSHLQRNLKDEEFRKLAVKLKDAALIDISPIFEPPSTTV